MLNYARVQVHLRVFTLAVPSASQEAVADNAEENHTAPNEMNLKIAIFSIFVT